jgi:ferredoxin
MADPKLVIDRVRCTGHGRCYELAPLLFEEDERGHSVLLQAEVPTGQIERARLAVASCPEDAIRLLGS